jgi:heat shock protein HtpX
LKTVHRLAETAKLKGMPEVGIYDSPEINAFATGPSERRSLVAVSTGLLRQMNEKEVEGVLAHEVAHIANGDMVTMTLIQGVVNAFVMFFARVIAGILTQNVREESRYLVNAITVFVLDIVFSFLAMFIVAWASRRREYRADYGGAALTDKSTMIAALERLKFQPGMDRIPASEPAYDTLKISNRRSGWMAWLSTHPDLDDRIARLRSAEI